MLADPVVNQQYSKFGTDARQLFSLRDAFSVWLVDANGFAPERAQPFLSDQECDRTQRFTTKSLRQRYVATHSTLRALLRDSYGIQAEHQIFEFNQFGKPGLVRYPDLHFSLSYSGQYGLIGISESCEIGVDIEQVREIGDAEELMQLHFTRDECTHVLKHSSSTPQASRAFLEVWTRKEACLKAFGLGLNMPLNEVECGPVGENTATCLGNSQYLVETMTVKSEAIVSWARLVEPRRNA